MVYRTALARLIERKQQEIDELQRKLVAAENFLAGLQESMKLVPRDPSDGGGDAEIREGSTVAKVRDFLKTTGKPVHIDQILEGIGRQKDKKTRASVAGSISGYARRGEVFVKTRPSTFGLIGMAAGPHENAVPADFGTEPTR